jgi:hypothetical protein
MTDRGLERSRRSSSVLDTAAGNEEFWSMTLKGVGHSELCKRALCQNDAGLKKFFEIFAGCLMRGTIPQLRANDPPPPVSRAAPRAPNAEPQVPSNH